MATTVISKTSLLLIIEKQATLSIVPASDSYHEWWSDQSSWRIQFVMPIWIKNAFAIFCVPDIQFYFICRCPVTKTNPTGPVDWDHIASVFTYFDRLLMFYAEFTVHRDNDDYRYRFHDVEKTQWRPFNEVAYGLSYLHIYVCIAYVYCLYISVDCIW